MNKKRQQRHSLDGSFEWYKVGIEYYFLNHTCHQNAEGNRDRQTFNPEAELLSTKSDSPPTWS